MIFHGRYRFNYGAYRPFITAYVLSTDRQWVKCSFLVDTGADETFLHHRGIDLLGLETKGLDVKDDVGGIGGYGVPYFEFDTEIKLVSPTESWIFTGKANVFLDPHATDVPILGRDVLDRFAVIFDRAREDVILISEPDGYEVCKAE